MTTSLLRRIWQRIISDKAAPPRQRLTGFEPLEPRMVLSGFTAFFAPDYFSPPPGDYSQIERAGAEIARPGAAFGGYSDYNSFGRGLAEYGHGFQTVQAVPLVGLFDHPAGDRIVGGAANDNWLTGMVDPVSPILSDQSPLSSDDAGGDSDYGYDDDGSFGKVTIITIVPGDSESPLDYISISPLAVDSILSELRGASSLSFSASFTPMTTMSAMSSPMRTLTDRDYNSVNSGGAVERHGDAHDIAALTTGAAAEAASAAARQATAAAIERSTLNAAANAALGNQAAGANSVAMQTADGTAANGQANVQANSSADHQQNSLLELTDAERLKLKRKLPGSDTETEETTESTADRVEQYDESESQVAYDPTRPFNAVMVSEGTLTPVAAANLTDDGMIEVLASDITVTLASGDVIAEAAANRQIVMEPAVATYQAFEIVVDGNDSDAAEVAANAARVAAAVAMSGQPMVQVE